MVFLTILIPTFVLSKHFADKSKKVDGSIQYRRIDESRSAPRGERQQVNVQVNHPIVQRKSHLFYLDNRKSRDTLWNGRKQNQQFRNWTKSGNGSTHRHDYLCVVVLKPRAYAKATAPNWYLPLHSKC